MSDEIVEEVKAPTPQDKEWSDYVLRHLEKDEIVKIDKKDCPLSAGLRRLVEKFIGEVIKSNSDVIQAPSQQNGHRAVCVHSITILKRDGRSQEGNGWILEYQDVADAHPGNTDALYMRFALATAATRAEARALRKALKLKATSAEEMVTNPVKKETYAEPILYITVNQEGYIRKVGGILGVNLEKFANLEQFGGPYKRLKDVPHEVAVQMINQLGEWQNDRDNIPPSVK
jgi:hypothetical protein